MGTVEALTLQHAVDNKFTCIDCVKYFNPEWTDGQCDYYLWDHTAYTFDSIEGLIKQLNKNFLKL